MSKFIIKAQEIIVSPTVSKNLTVPLKNDSAIIISTEFWNNLLAESLAGFPNGATKELYEQLGVSNEAN